MIVQNVCGQPVSFTPVPGDDPPFTWLPGVATGVKVVLYFLCVALAAKSSSAMALAEDHRNDILSNTVAIATAAAASNYK